MQRLFLFVLVLLIVSSAPVGSKSEQEETKHVFDYPINVLAVHDGDTMIADIDMGLSVSLKDQKIRLLGCDAFELSTGEKGARARDFARRFVETGKPLTMLTFGERDSFGRILGEVLNQGQVSLTEALIQEHLVTDRFLDSPLPSRTLKRISSNQH